MGLYSRSARWRIAIILVAGLFAAMPPVADAAKGGAGGGGGGGGKATAALDSRTCAAMTGAWNRATLTCAISGAGTLTKSLSVPARTMLTIAQTGSLTIPAGITLTLEPGGVDYDGGQVSNDGVIACRGTLANRYMITNGTGATIRVFGGGLLTDAYMIDNHGDIDVSSGTLSNAAGAIISNTGGRLLVTAGGQVANDGQISESADYSIEPLPEGSLLITGTGSRLANTGSLVNGTDTRIEIGQGAVLASSGTISNSNRSEIEITGSLSSTGAITNLGGGLLHVMPLGTLQNAVGATLQNNAEATITNDGVLNNCGTISNAGTWTGKAASSSCPQP